MSQYDGKPTPIYTLQFKAWSDSPWQIVERSYLTRKVAIERAKSYRHAFPGLRGVRLLTSVVDEALTVVL